jgi:hypothetical protein
MVVFLSFADHARIKSGSILASLLNNPTAVPNFPAFALFFCQTPLKLVFINTYSVAEVLVSPAFISQYLVWRLLYQVLHSSFVVLAFHSSAKSMHCAMNASASVLIAL